MSNSEQIDRLTERMERQEMALRMLIGWLSRELGPAAQGRLFDLLPDSIEQEQGVNT